MADLISREAAIEAALDGADDWDGGYNPERERCIREHMAKVPSVDAAPVVHGRWQIRESGPGEIECKCSVCKYRDFVPRNDVYWVNRKFCPNCGAKMDGERRDSE